jgi:hypothetical protein
MKNSLTDKHLCIYVEQKFADIRAKSKDEYISIKKKKMDKRNKLVRVPKYRIGDKLVITNSCYDTHNTFYLYVQLLDFDVETSNYYEYYYAIILKTNNTKFMNRIGRLIYFQDSGYLQDFHPANVDEKGIKWLLL